TKLTSAEFAELTLYRAAIQIFHKNQIPGAASCQSFVNAIECFLRNQGYHQVIGIDEQLDMNVAPGAPTAVVCWNVAELRSCYFTTFLHDVDSDAFRKAIQSGEQAGASPENDSIDQLNGERYLLLRTTPTGEEGHFVNLVRSKASGRFIVIDGQKENIYPVIHPEPDFTITDDADKDITQRNIYAFRTDLIPDSIFSEELKRSNALMQSSITAQKASLSTG
nr:hypothetical protein [Endozoicomonas sp.]